MLKELNIAIDGKQFKLKIVSFFSDKDKQFTTVIECSYLEKLLNKMVADGFQLQNANINLSSSEAPTVR